MAEFELSKDQQGALDAIQAWYEEGGKKPFVLAGAAGTGKTSLLTHLEDLLEGNPHTAFAAYTGKAADVLTRKGIEASTIHSLIYFNKVSTDDKGKEKFFTRLKPQAELAHIGIIIVDEASMVSEDIYNDLMHFNIPLLFVGDHQQLPPIDGELNLMENPTYTLIEIHRQAQGDPIIGLAHDAYNGFDIEEGRYGRSGVIHSRKINTAMMCNADQVICGKNVTRRNLNGAIRQHLGFTGALPQAGEKLICLRNSADKMFRNGKCYEVVDFIDDYDTFRMFKLHLVDVHDPDKEIIPVDIRYDNFIPGDHWKESNSVIYRNAQTFDFGYAITAHKAQGSEWDKVLVINEPFGSYENQRRWSYTAFTRAKEQLVVAI